MMKVTGMSATLIYSGMIDYWGGDGRRWDDDAGCLFAHYGPATTVRDIVDELCDDFCVGGDCDSFPEHIGDDEIRATLLDMLSAQGRRDYNSGALSEFAIEFAACNDLHKPVENPEVGDEVRIDGLGDGDSFGEIVKINRYDDGEIRKVVIDVDGRRVLRDPDEVYEYELVDDFNELPVVIVLVELDQDDDGFDEDGWTLCQHDDGRWSWAHYSGKASPIYDTEDAAYDAHDNGEF
jgi:hypothetical protein